jgi:hypothetical protein
MEPLMPHDIAGDVQQVLAAARVGKNGDRPNFLTAYQILDRIPAAVRDRLIAERTLGGRGSGVAYAAPSVVSDAAERLPGIVIEYMDSVGLSVSVTGQQVVPSNPVCGLYRLASDAEPGAVADTAAR